MFFDFEDGRPDIAPVGQQFPASNYHRTLHLKAGPLSLQLDLGPGRPLSRTIAVAGSWAVHLLVLGVIFFAPQLFRTSIDASRARLARLNPEPERDQTQFVFVQPRLDTTAPKAPELAPPSDKDREARAPDRAPNPENPLPRSRGNTPERVEEIPEAPARGRGPEPDPATGADAQQREQPVPESQSPLQLPRPPLQPLPDGAGGRSAAPGGSLGDSLRNLQRFVQSETFDNPRGGNNEFGPAIQFDTKGVEFGPWVRRFIAQVKRNWFIPNAAMFGERGHVVITFNVHKNGAITDLTVVGPCPIEAFNTAAFGALASSNPTQPLPPEYPAEKAFFTVTFFYNEPPQ